MEARVSASQHVPPGFREAPVWEGNPPDWTAAAEGTESPEVLLALPVPQGSQPRQGKTGPQELSLLETPQGPLNTSMDQVTRKVPRRGP